MHNVDVKFTQAYLPDAKKLYNLKTANQTELDLRGVAAKAKAYKLIQNVEDLVNGFTNAMEAICYLVADGYRVKTDYFTVGLRVPGEYDGNEKNLPEGISPLVRVQISRALQNYIKERVNIGFDGTIDTEGFIAGVTDEATGATDGPVTPGRLLTIFGSGLKIDAEPGNRENAGVYFTPEAGEPVKVMDIAINEPRTLKVIVPQALQAGTSYRIVVDTQTPIKSNGKLLKSMRKIESGFSVTAIQ